MPRRFEMPEAEGKTPRYPIGTVILSRNSVTSKTEQMVREKLVAAGLRLHKGRSAIQCGLEPGKGNYPILTPDILVSKTKVCIEVDPSYHHAGDAKLATDRLRNSLLEGAGWTVIRLRLGGLEPIGDRDVVCESESPTMASITALIDAVENAAAGRPGTVRRIAKAPMAPRKKARLGAISEHKYYEGAHYVSWTLDSGEVLRLVAVCNGLYLAQSQGWGFPRFIRYLGLESTPRSAWRNPLEAILSEMSEADFEPVSNFPWGDSLFTGPQSEAVVLSEKFNLGCFAWDLTANIDGVHAYSEKALLSEDGKVQAELHDDAVRLGWRIEQVAEHTGFRGGFQRIRLLRVQPEQSYAGDGQL